MRSCCLEAERRDSISSGTLEVSQNWSAYTTGDTQNTMYSSAPAALNAYKHMFLLLITCIAITALHSHRYTGLIVVRQCCYDAPIQNIIITDEWPLVQL